MILKDERRWREKKHISDLQDSTSSICSVHRYIYIVQCTFSFSYNSIIAFILCVTLSHQAALWSLSTSLLNSREHECKKTNGIHVSFIERDLFYYSLNNCHFSVTISLYCTQLKCRPLIWHLSFCFYLVCIRRWEPLPPRLLCNNGRWSSPLILNLICSRPQHSLPHSRTHTRTRIFGAFDTRMELCSSSLCWSKATSHLETRIVWKFYRLQIQFSELVSSQQISLRFFLHNSCTFFFCLISNFKMKFFGEKNKQTQNTLNRGILIW